MAFSNVEVIDLRTLRPLDIKTVIESVRKTNRLVCIEEGWISSGIGAEITSSILDKAFYYLDAPPKRIAAKDVPIPYSAGLETLSLPTIESIVMACKSLLNLKITN